MHYLLTWSEGEEVEYRIVEDINSFMRFVEEKNGIITALDV